MSITKVDQFGDTEERPGEKLDEREQYKLRREREKIEDSFLFTPTLPASSSTQDEDFESGADGNSANHSDKDQKSKRKK